MKITPTYSAAPAIEPIAMPTVFPLTFGFSLGFESSEPESEPALLPFPPLSSLSSPLPDPEPFPEDPLLPFEGPLEETVSTAPFPGVSGMLGSIKFIRAATLLSLLLYSLDRGL